MDSLLRETNAVAVELRSIFVGRWVEADPGAAAKWVAHLPENASGCQLRQQVAVAWAGKSLAEASAWVKSLADGAGKDAAAVGLAY